MGCLFCTEYVMPAVCPLFSVSCFFTLHEHLDKNCSNEWNDLERLTGKTHSAEELAEY